MMLARTAIALLASYAIYTLAAAAEPPAATNVLFAIGTTNADTREFALAPAAHREWATRLPSDPLFVVGRSTPERDWPYSHPGPADVWAGGRAHTFTVVFFLESAPAAGTARLVVDLVDTHWSAPPRLTVALNGTAQPPVQMPKGASDAAIDGDPGKGRNHSFSVDLPGALLKVGRNDLTILNDNGSWVLYDALRLEVPPGAVLGDAPELLLASASVDPCLYGAGDELHRKVALGIWLHGKARPAVVKLDGADMARVELAEGSQSIELRLPPADKAQQRELVIESGGEVLASRTLDIPPTRRWIVYLLPHSHNDIGYTEPQPAVLERQIGNIEKGIELARASAEYPEGARFKWNTEILWAVDGFIRRGADKDRELGDAVKGGWIGLDAFYTNTLTGMCREEELMRLVRMAKRLEDRWGAPVDAAMISDIPGLTWGVATVLAHAGVRYLSDAPNFTDRIGGALSTWQDKPFYWVSPTGSEKILVWTPFRGYALGHTWLGWKIERHLIERLAALEQQNYQYDIVALRWNVGADNGPPDETLADTVRKWNESHAYPKLIIATTSEAFHAFEKQYGDKLPTFKGDFTPYWEDGTGSTALETGLVRNAVDRLVQAETLWALRGPRPFPAAAFEDAWKHVLLYSEHTWGACNSISEPDAPSVQEQWRNKQAFANEAVAASHRLVAESATGAAQPGAIDVWNTTSWPRTELVRVPKEVQAPGYWVIDDAGQPVTTDHMTSGELAFIATDVPPFAARRYTLSTQPVKVMERAHVEGLVLSNEKLSVTLDEATGAIRELRTAQSGHNFARTDAAGGLNDYLYLPGADLKDLKRSGPARIRIKEQGALVASLEVESDAPGCRKLMREVRLTGGADYVEIIDTLDKLPIREKEGVHFGFAFNVPDGDVRIDVPWAVMRPNVDQIPGSNKNWFCVQRWVDVSNAELGVTWATLDAPLIELGGITANLLGSQTDPNGWRQHVEPTQTLYSWALNNHWHTNSKADQEGTIVFRYAIRPHAVYSPIEAARFAVGLSKPLLVAPATGNLRRTPRLTIEPPDVIATAVKPSDAGEALIVRLFNASGEPRRASVRFADPQPGAVYLSDAGERAREPAPATIDLPTWGVVTLRATFGGDLAREVQP